MKRIFALILAGLITTAAFTACGNGEESSSAGESSGSEVSSSVEESVNAPVFNADALKTTVCGLMKDAYLEMPADAIYNDTGINPETFAEGFWVCEDTGNSAETVAVYKAISEEEGENIRTLLKNKLTSLQNQYKDYNADNYQMSLKAVVGGEGVYAYIVISPNVESINNAIKAAIAG